MMIGHTLAHYRISAAIGSGGMGEVYRATDAKLGREVALKILPADVASDPGRLERFRREARAVAALNHQNIVTLYSVEEVDGTHFLTMELVEGAPLDRLIPRTGLDAERSVAIGMALADALAAAHDKGIIHRDLKPANVMITTDGRVKVLDFGLAKEMLALDPPDATYTSAGHTQPGVVMGTPAYMSPEQVAGRPVDHRTDIFSLGVLLYEMVSGTRPFAGDSSAELASAILRDTPASLIEVRAGIPLDLARIVRRCLEKDVRHRLQTARDVCNELRELATAPRGNSPSGPAAAGLRREEAPRGSGPARQDDGFWIAVLPFKHRGADADLAALAEGLTEEIVTGLSRFSYLRVIARSSSGEVKGSRDVRTVGAELGARYVMDGTLRQAGSTLRLTVQVVDAVSGAHLWAETYARPFQAADVFALQDDLVPRIVSTVADWYGVLPRSMSDAVRSKAADAMSPYESVLRSFGYFARFTPEEHAIVRAALERAVEQAPGSADAWAMLSMIYGEEFRFCFNVRPEPLERALQAARRAVDTSPSNHLAHLALAQALFFRKELPTFRSAADRAIALNPLDGATMEYMAHLIAFSGDWAHGCALAEQARQLNPNHPGWYWATAYYDAYRKGEYRDALTLAVKAQTGGESSFTRMILAAIYGQLGERKAAEQAVRELLALAPGFAAAARGELAKWYLPDLVDDLIDGLGKAGLDIPGAAGSATAPGMGSAAVPGSGASRADEGFWIAVLPFVHAGSDEAMAALAEGLSDEIVTGFSRFSYLRVIARSSTRRYAGGTSDVRAVGRELGARYVMEGTVRQAGEQVRVSVQLVDAATGGHLWAETYTRPFHPDGIFEVQDDLIPRIVSTCADSFGVLARSISDAVRDIEPSELGPYEALMRGFGYHHRLTPDEHAIARNVLERAVERAPGNADCWAMLSWTYSHEHAHGFNPQPGSLDRALSAARRAVELAPSNHVAQQALAVVLFFRKETAACLGAAERALALNPLDGSNEAIFLVAFTGDWERGCGLIARAMELNPHHPGWYRLVLAMNEYRKENYRATVAEAIKANVPGIFWTHMLLAAAHGQLGNADAGAIAMKDLLAQKDGFGSAVRELLGKWFEPQFTEQVVDGLRKAGMAIDEPPLPGSR